MTVTILAGHVLDKLQDIEPNSVQVCVTLPPFFNLRDYKTPPQVWGGDAECRHEWTPNGRSPQRIRNGQGNTTLHESGPHGTQPHGAQRLPSLDANVTLNPTQGDTCQSCNAWRGELGQEPTLAIYLDHLLMVFDGVRRVLRPDGCLFVNLGDSFYSSTATQGRNENRSAVTSLTKRGASGRSPALDVQTSTTYRRKDDFKPKDLMLVPHRFAIAMQDRGWYVRNDLVWAKTACMPESVTDRATRSHEYIFHFAKQAKYFYDADAVKESVALATENDKRIGTTRDIPRPNRGFVGSASQGATALDTNPAGCNQRTVWTIGPEPLRDEHYAAWPTEIPRRCILAGSKPGDTVLDPFIGSGRTAIVADRLGRDCIGIELSPVNVAMSERLIRGDSPMFAQVAVIGQAAP